MNESKIEKSLNDLNFLMSAGNAMHSLEKHYHYEVEMHENNSPSTKGKESNRQQEIKFFNNIIEVRDASIVCLAVNGSTSFVIWSYDYARKQWGDRKYTQVAVQNWQDGKIIKEQFFYGN